MLKQKALETLKPHSGAKGLVELAHVIALGGGALDGYLQSRPEAAVFDMRQPQGAVARETISICMSIAPAAQTYR